MEIGNDELHMMFRSCRWRLARERPREVLSESRMREIRTSGSMSGGVETERRRTMKAPPDERGGERHAQPNVTAPSTLPNSARPELTLREWSRQVLIAAFTRLHTQAAEIFNFTALRHCCFTSYIAVIAAHLWMGWRDGM